VLTGKHLSGPTQPSLNLVHDEYDSMVAANLLEPAKIIRRVLEGVVGKAPVKTGMV
jgi:hypothetical protein